jgi:hypothetical protein
MALIAIVAWSAVILGISIVAMVFGDSDPTFTGEESYDLASRRSA